MSPTDPEEQGFFARSVPMRWLLATVLCLLVIMAIIIVVLVLDDRGNDEVRRAEAAAATSTTDATSPYDLTELPIGADRDAVEDAAFVSIFTPDETGKLTSYGISSELPIARQLIEAVKKADEVDPGDASAALGSKAAESTITFVLPTRETVTFALYLDQGMIARGAEVWRPDSDFATLVETAISGPE